MKKFLDLKSESKYKTFVKKHIVDDDPRSVDQQIKDNQEFRVSPLASVMAMLIYMFILANTIKQLCF